MAKRTLKKKIRDTVTYPGRFANTTMSAFTTGAAKTDEAAKKYLTSSELSEFRSDVKKSRARRDKSVNKKKK